MSGSIIAVDVPSSYTDGLAAWHVVPCHMGAASAIVHALLAPQVEHHVTPVVILGSRVDHLTFGLKLAREMDDQQIQTCWLIVIDDGSIRPIDHAQLSRMGLLCITPDTLPSTLAAFAQAGKPRCHTDRLRQLLMPTDADRIQADRTGFIEGVLYGLSIATPADGRITTTLLRQFFDFISPRQRQFDPDQQAVVDSLGGVHVLRQHITRVVPLLSGDDQRVVALLLYGHTHVYISQSLGRERHWVGRRLSAFLPAMTHLISMSVAETVELDALVDVATNPPVAVTAHQPLRLRRRNPHPMVRLCAP